MDVMEVTMRAVALVLVFLGVAGPVAAQQAPVAMPAGPAGCWPVATREQVVITRTDGAQQRATLVCMGADEVVLAGSGSLPLSSVRQIVKPRDGIGDGLLKGAALGLVIFALCAGECDGEYLLRGTLGYAAIGGTIDALQGNNKTIYRKDPRSASVAWRIRF
jgi:hypothetical protein